MEFTMGCNTDFIINTCEYDTPRNFLITLIGYEINLEIICNVL